MFKPEWERIYQEYKDLLIKNKSKSQDPKAYMIGGQPGAGKSYLIDSLLEAQTNAIFINGDHIRTKYPEAIKLTLEEYPVITQPFVNIFVERLIDELSEEKYDLIIEGTLRDKNVPLRTSTLLKERDYDVELQILAVSKELSWASTKHREEYLARIGGIPRTVEKEKHDAIVNMLPVTVKELNMSDTFDNILILTRDKEILYDRSEHKGIREPDQMLKEELNSSICNVNEYIKGKMTPGEQR